MKKQFLIMLIARLIGGSLIAGAQRRPASSPYSGEGRVEKIRFHLYTDSIKPVLNYYVNVEGTFSSGRVLPLDTSLIDLTADYGVMAGNEWVVPKKMEAEKVTFRAVVKERPELVQTVTVYIKKYRDPQDEVPKEELDMPVVPKRMRR